MSDRLPMSSRAWRFYLVRQVVRMTMLLIVLAGFGLYNSWVMGWL